VVFFKGLRKYSAVFYLVMFFASSSPAAATSPDLPSVTIARTMRPTNESSVKTSVGIDSECFTGYVTNFRIVIADPERRDNMPVGSINECFEEPAPLALHKDGDKNLGIAPSLAKFSPNPIDDSRNSPTSVTVQFLVLVGETAHQPLNHPGTASGDSAGLVAIRLLLRSSIGNPTT
jgi:hypothetical protein